MSGRGVLGEGEVLDWVEVGRDWQIPQSQSSRSAERASRYALAASWGEFELSLHPALEAPEFGKPVG